MSNSRQNLRESNFQDLRLRKVKLQLLRNEAKPREACATETRARPTSYGRSSENEKGGIQILTIHLSQVRLEPALSAQRMYLSLCQPGIISSPQDLEAGRHLLDFSGSRSVFHTSPLAPPHRQQPESELGIQSMTLLAASTCQGTPSVFLGACALIPQLPRSWSAPCP